MSTLKADTLLLQEVTRFQRRWRAGLWLTGVLAALFWAGAALVFFGVVDAVAGFSDGGRHVVAGALGAIGGAAVLYGLWQGSRFAQRDAAYEVDRVTGDPRRSALTALELAAQPVPNERLAAWLREEAVRAAAKRVSTVPTERAWPVRPLRRAGYFLAALLIVVAACFMFAPRYSRVIAQRLLNPSADVPPPSPLQFTLGPKPAKVLYGNDLVVVTQITGGAINGPVRCLTRDPQTGRVDEFPAYRETSNRYSQKLESLSAPVEVAFAVGRARSQWLPVTVQMQPQVQSVTLIVEPPAYSNLPRREFALSTQPLSILAGSRVTARVVSNRPLSGGLLQLHTGVPGQAPQQVSAVVEDSRQVSFAWFARLGGRLELTVRDALQTSSERLEFEQKVLPDGRPAATIQDPVGEVLATPEAELPLEYSASDDLGVARLALVRRLGSYRERALTEPVPPGRRHHSVQSKLSLAPYGVQPGQTIELSVEAGDTNPTLLGVAASEPVRIRIISKEDYAERLRRELTLEEFTSRYEAMEEAMENARKALEELAKAAASGDQQAAEAARQKAEEAHQEAAKIFGGIARDFPILKMDESLANAAGDVAKRLYDNQKALEELKGKSAQELAQAAPELRDRLGEAQERIAEDQQRGERAAKAGAVMEQAGKFLELLQEQRDLVKDMDRVTEAVRRGEMAASQALPEMERRQKEVAEGLKNFEKELVEAAQELPKDFAQLHEGCASFLDKLHEQPIAPLMDEAVAAAAKSDARTAGERAGEALAHMEALLRDKNKLSEMMRQQMGEPAEGDQSLQWPGDLSDSMRELLEGLCRKPGSGEGEKEGPGGTGGKGIGGNSPHGFSMPGKRPKLPIFGPSRQKFAQRNSSMGGRSPQDGRGGGDSANADIHREEGVAATPRAMGGESVAPEAVPEAYRDAVKRYFLPTEPSASTTNSK